MTEHPGLLRGLAHLRAQEFFAAHEELELAWRQAPPDQRDFLQGLVHVAVAWHHAQRGHLTGSVRQLEKATRRLSHYPASHRGVDLDALRAQLQAAGALLRSGATHLGELRI